MILPKVTKILLIVVISANNFTVKAFGSSSDGGEQISKMNPFQHLERLDHKGKYWLEWSVNWINKSVVFNATVETKGYIGFGLSKKGKMSGADIVIGGVFPNGRAYFSDRHAVARQIPIKDKSQDWTLHGAWENSSHTFLSFSRPFDTCDVDYDLPIKDGSIVIIWAYGEKDNDIQYHFENRGHFQINLLNSDLTPQRVKQAERNNERLTKLGDTTNVWGIYSGQTMPAKDTTYLCTFHKAPVHSGKQHIIGYRPIIESDTDRRHVHHFLMYRCYPPKGISSARRFFDRFVGQLGVECYNTHLPSSIPSEYCRELVYALGLGAKTFFLPDHVGIPLNLDSSDEYFMLQVHYDNPEMIPGIQVNYGLEIFYTENIRKYDGGVMFVGLGFPGSPSLVIPSHSINHAFYGHCGGACTRKMFPPSGINIVGGVLHTHFAGVAVKIAHVRNGRELAPIWDDSNYISTYQQFQTLREERTVLPGDSIIAKCMFSTTDRNGSATVGGFSYQNEMCNTIMWYYPRAAASKNGNKPSPVYSTCSSEIRSEEYGSFLGIQNYTWSDRQVDFVVTAPLENAGLTTRQVTTRTEWSIEKREQLQNYHKNLPHVTWCPDLSAEAVGQPRSLPGLSTSPNWRNNEYMSNYSEDSVIPYKRISKSCSES